VAERTIPQPSGRPKSNFSFKKELETKLGEVNERDYLKQTYGRIIIDRVVELASKRNPSIRAVSEILDRVLGKPVQAVTLVSREQRIAKIGNTDHEGRPGRRGQEEETKGSPAAADFTARIKSRVIRILKT
jgi:hypothetical protein